MMRRRWSQAAPPIAAVLLLLVLWQLGVAIFKVESWILPSPLAVAREAWNHAPALLEHTWATLQLTLIGFSIGAAFGLLVAMLLHPFPLVKRALYPLIIISQNVPTIVLLPLLMIWFGFGLLPKIVVITLVCFFPITVAAMDGLMQTDRTMLRYMRMAGASRSQLFWKLEMPSALPSIFSGLKIAATYSVMSSIVAEWMGTDKGIGYYMTMQKAAFRTDRMFVAIFIIIALCILLFTIVQAVERRVIHWQAQRSEQGEG